MILKENILQNSLNSWNLLIVFLVYKAKVRNWIYEKVFLLIALNIVVK